MKKYYNSTCPKCRADIEIEMDGFEPLDVPEQCDNCGLVFHQAQRDLMFGEALSGFMGQEIDRAELLEND